MGPGGPPGPGGPGGGPGWGPPGPGGPGGGPGWGPPGPGGPGGGPGWGPPGPGPAPFPLFCGLCDFIGSCLSCLCCCWLIRDCCGGPMGPPR